MSNYDAVCRSNYFKVKDVEAFQKFCKRIGAEFFGVIDREEYVCGFGKDGSLPNWDLEKDDELDFFGELATHLEDKEIAIIMESGHEKFSYVTGYAWAINNKGDYREVSLQEIYSKLAGMGNKPIACEY
jgi:hypothetical protein